MGNQHATSIVNSAISAGLDVSTQAYLNCKRNTDQVNQITISGSNQVYISQLIQENYIVLLSSCYLTNNLNANLKQKIETAVVTSIEQSIKGFTGGETGKIIINTATSLATSISTSLTETCTAASNQSNVVTISNASGVVIYASKQENIAKGNLQCLARQNAVVNSYTTLINEIQSALNQKNTGFLTSIWDAIINGAKELVLAVILIIGAIIGFIILAIVGGFTFFTHPAGFLTLLLAGVALFSLFLILAYLFKWYPYSNELFGIGASRNTTILVVALILFVLSVIGLIAIAKEVKRPTAQQDLSTVVAGAPIAVVGGVEASVQSLDRLKQEEMNSSGRQRKEYESEIKSQEGVIKQEVERVPKNQQSTILAEAKQLAEEGAVG